MQRIASGRLAMELYEEGQKLAVITEAYDRIFTNRLEVMIIDGEQNREQIHEQIYQHFRRVYPLQKQA